MNSRTWDITKPKKFSFFSIETDRLEIGSANLNDIKIIPFTFLTHIFASENSRSLKITYKRINDYESKIITFKNIEERDEAFELLSLVLESKFIFASHNPKKITGIWERLTLLMFPALFLGVALTARDFERGIGFGRPPRDRLESIIQAFIMLVCLLGSKILFIISILLFLICIGIIIYYIVTTPANLPMEKSLKRQEEK